jgi:hypothetical protein
MHVSRAEPVRPSQLDEAEPLVAPLLLPLPEPKVPLREPLVSPVADPLAAPLALPLAEPLVDPPVAPRVVSAANEMLEMPSETAAAAMSNCCLVIIKLLE